MHHPVVYEKTNDHTDNIFFSKNGKVVVVVGGIYLLKGKTKTMKI